MNVVEGNKGFNFNVFLDRRLLLMVNRVNLSILKNSGFTTFVQ